MRCVIFFMLIGTLLNCQISTDNHMEEKFCQALIDNDRATLKAIINTKLDTLKMANNLDENFELLMTWIEELECVTEVEKYPDLLDTEPPVQEFNITISINSGNQIKRSIGIRITEEKLLFDYKEID